MVYDRIHIVVGVSVTVEQARGLCQCLEMEDVIVDPEEDPYFDDEPIVIMTGNLIIQFFS